MRLTLRTLLAYRDRVLNSSELEDMHRRVQQSAMAGNLLKRLDALSQRTNILAPPIEGTGLGADANSIAEYLDDSLKGDKVPELERICLESDVQLAELAQCHSLLSAALSTTVEVPGTLRQRVVALGNESERAQALARRHQRPAIEPEPAQSREPVGRTLDAPNGTRYRADEPHHDGSQPDNSGQMAKPKERVLVQAQAVTAPMVASGGDSIRPTGLDLEGSHLAHEVPEYLRGRSRDGWLAPLAILGLVCLLSLLVWQSVGSWSSLSDMFTLGANETEQPEPKADSNVTTQPNVVKDPNATVPAPTSNSKDNAPAAPADPSNPSSNNASPPVARSSLNSQPSTEIRKPSGEPLPAAAEHVAQWLPADASAMQAVVLVQTAGGVLHRLMPSEGLASGCQIFVPSANRPKIDIVRGPQWQACGLTHAMLIKPDTGAQAETQVDLRIGRAVVTGGQAGQGLGLTTPAGSVRLVLTGTSSLAVEVSYVPGAHGPVTNRASYLPTLTLTALDGDPEIAFNGQSIKLPANNKVLMQNNRISQPEASESPLWIDSSFDRPVDLLAAADLSKQLAGDAPIGEVLQGLATNRRPETRALAAQTLSLLGSWEWVAQAKSSLSDTRDRSYWAALLDRTRQILAAHPENVDALAASLSQLDPQTAQWRLSMWLGLDAAQLQADGSKAILASLESDALMERILAIQQLQRATGKDLGYQPAEPSRNIVTQWARELSNGKSEFLPAPKS